MNDCAVSVARSAEHLLKEEHDSEYSNLPRKVGHGPHSIDTFVQFSEDIYSCLFMSTVHAEYIHAVKAEVEKGEELHDAILDDFREKNPDW